MANTGLKYASGTGLCSVAAENDMKRDVKRHCRNFSVYLFIFNYEAGCIKLFDRRKGRMDYAAATDLVRATAQEEAKRVIFSLLDAISQASTMN